MEGEEAGETVGDAAAAAGASGGADRVVPGAFHAEAGAAVQGGVFGGGQGDRFLGAEFALEHPGVDEFAGLDDAVEEERTGSGSVLEHLVELLKGGDGRFGLVVAFGSFGDQGREG